MILLLLLGIALAGIGAALLARATRATPTPRRVIPRSRKRIIVPSFQTLMLMIRLITNDPETTIRAAKTSAMRPGRVANKGCM